MYKVQIQSQLVPLQVANQSRSAKQLWLAQNIWMTDSVMGKNADTSTPLHIDRLVVPKRRGCVLELYPLVMDVLKIVSSHRDE